VADPLRAAMIAPRLVSAPTVTEAVRWIESPAFDPQTMIIVPHQRALSVATPPRVRVLSSEEAGQTLRFRFSTPAPVLLFVNQSYFSAWVAMSGDRELETLPVDLDRLGIIVPAGEHEIVLRFGRHRTLIAAAWFASLLVLTAAAVSLRIEHFDRGPGEIERAGNDDAALR
jgi:hypothetical protein